MKEESVCKAFTYLEEGPVIWVTTNNGSRKDIMTISWQMVMDFVGHIALSTGPWNESFETMMQTKECVIAVPDASYMETAVGIGTCNGSRVNKFETFGLTAIPAKDVRAPLIGECIANIECFVEDYIEGHGLVVLKAKRLWINPAKANAPRFHAIGDGTFVTDGEHRNLRSQMEKWVPTGV